MLDMQGTNIRMIDPKRILAKNSDDLPVIQTEFYYWLNQGNWADRRSTAIINYLDELYFYKRGVDRISEHLTLNLCIIYDYFTEQVMHPVWNK